MKKTKFVNEVVYMSSEMIEDSLRDNTRQYLQGNLKREQNLPFIYNDRSEIGISCYREFSCDEPHYHDLITETNYILEGRLCLKIVDTGEEYVVEKGGVYSVPPKVLHVVKVQSGTKVIFVKDHAVNDKKTVDPKSLGLERWMEDEGF